MVVGTTFDALPFLQLFLGFSLVVKLFHLYLDVRQLKAIELPNPPKELAADFDDELYRKTQDYSRDKWWFGLYHGLVDFVCNMVGFAIGLMPAMWHLAGRALQHLPMQQVDAWGGPKWHEVAHTVVFVLLFLALSLALDLPWSLYSTFHLEQKHGFNKQTLGLFVSDFIKQILLGLLLVPPVLTVVTRILQESGRWLPLYLCGFLVALQLVMMTIYPVLIAPLFNKYDALPDSSLRNRIEQLAVTVKFPLKKLFRVDGSKRSTHSNAYMYGFGSNKRIVLYDTLINQCGEEEVVAVLAHELGHWKLRHTSYLFAVGVAVMLFQFSLFAFVRNSDGLYRSFGFGDIRPAFVSLMLFQPICAPLDEVISFLSNMVSRTFEFQADGFAVSLGHGEKLRQALLRLEEQNKSSMNVDRLYSAYHYSHPPLVERLKAIRSGTEAEDKKRL